MSEDAATLFREGRIVEALETCKIVLANNSADADASFIAGQCYFKLREFESSISLFRRAIEIRPQCGDYFSDLGVALKAVGRIGEAEAILRHAIYLSPDSHWPKMGLANLLVQRGLIDEPEDLYRRTIMAQPRFAGAYQNLGNLLLSHNRVSDAVDLAKAMLAIAPSDQRAYTQLSVALERDHKLTEALSLTKLALDLSDAPNLDMNTASYASLIGLTGTIESRADVSVRIHRALARDQSDVPYYQLRELDLSALRRFSFLLPYYGISDIDHRGVIELLGEKIAESVQVCSEHSASSDFPLKIGYLSYNFGDHPIGHLLSPFFEQHDPARSSLYLYSLNGRPNDISEYPMRIKSAANVYRDLSTLNDNAAAEVIMSDQINILIDLDGYLGGGRPGILARRPAPVQIHWLQHLSGMPAPFIDYTILDKTLATSAEAYEVNSQIIRLDSAFQCGDQVTLPVDPPNRASVGLPNDRFVFCGFNSWLKIDDSTFSCWMEILKAVPASVLWLSSGGGENDPEPLCRAAQSAGVDRDRLIFAPRLPIKRDHLNRHRCADLFLDTFDFSAATTAVDALWAGLPVLTKSGSTSYSRLSMSLLSALGLTEMVVQDRRRYIDAAIAFGNGDLDLPAIKTKLRRIIPSSKLFDSHYLADQFEVIYKKCWTDFTLRKERRSFDIVGDRDQIDCSEPLFD